MFVWFADLMLEYFFFNERKFAIEPLFSIHVLDRISMAGYGQLMNAWARAVGQRIFTLPYYVVYIFYPRYHLEFQYNIHCTRSYTVKA